VYQGTGQAFETAYGKDLATARDQLAAARRRRRGDVGTSALNGGTRPTGKIRDADTGGTGQGPSTRRPRPRRTSSSRTSRTPRRRPDERGARRCPTG
jgi:hypothetical protein